MDAIAKNVSGHPQIAPRVYRSIEALYLILSGYTLLSLSVYFFCITKTKNGHPESNQEICWRPWITMCKVCSSNCLQPYCLHHNAQKAMSTLIVLMILSVLAHVSVDFWAYFPNHVTQAHVQCVRHAASGILYILCILNSYLFLWIRQRVFYTHPTLRRLVNPCLNRFSISVLLMIVISNTFLLVTFFLLPATDKRSDSSQEGYNVQKTSPVSRDAINYTSLGLVVYGCGFQRKNRYLLIHFLFTLTVVFYQISLQFLFAYPVLKLRNKNSKMLKQVKTSISNTHASVSSRDVCIEMGPRQYTTPDDTRNLNDFHQADSEDSNFSISSSKIREADNSICQQCETEGVKETSALDESHSNQCKAERRNMRQAKLKRLQRKLRAKNKLKCYVFRCLALSLVCSVSDIAEFIFIYFTQALHQQETVSESMLTSLSYNTNLIINLFCMLGCYNDWKLRLFPFRCCFTNNKLVQ